MKRKARSQFNEFFLFFAASFAVFGRLNFSLTLRVNFFAIRL